MKICVLSAFEDSMLRDTGGSVRIYNLLKGLVAQGHTVELIIPKTSEDCKIIDGVVVRSFNGLLPQKIIQKLSKILGIEKPTSLFFYDPIFIQKAAHIMRKSDISQFEQQSTGILLAITAKTLKKHVVSDCHDVFQALRAKNTTALRKFLETFLEKLFYKVTSKILVVSDSEKQLLLSLGIGKDNITVIPNGVDTKTYTPSINNTTIRQRYGLLNSRIVVFVGNLQYAPNQEAVHLISSQIAPKTEKAVSNVKFVIVGRQDRTKYANMHYLGVVDDVAAILTASDIAIAPLFHGSGTRLKILEYFSAGLPVISTTIGAEGLPVENGVNILIEDDIDKFTQKLIDCLNNKDAAMKMGKAARDIVVKKYDWNIIITHLNEVYTHLIPPVKNN